MHIGIDVGGTNTDAVLMEGTSVVASVKRSTTADVTSGIVDALAGLAAEQRFDPKAVQAVMVGTTHFTNAVVSGDGLARTGVLRLGLPAGAGIPPMSDWPDHLADAIGRHVHQAHGGHEFDGRAISDLRPAELRRIAAELGEAGVRTVAITSVFSPVTAEAEIAAAEIIAAELPHVKVSLSHELGRIGLLERENATIVNAALLDVAEHATEAFRRALAGSGIDAPLYLSQNDGTLMDIDYARDYPVATFASGPTNSMRGAALLSGLSDCLVVDVGGTTADIGVLVGGFPRPAGAEVEIGGVRTNFRMPDVVAIGIGGGSLVHTGNGPLRVGPGSVGHRLTSEARVFGGGTLTATDLAVAAGIARIGDPALVADLDPALVRDGLEHIARRIAETADTMRTSAEPLPMVLVGGGSVLVPGALPGFETVLRPEHASVANAIGAAIAQVGGEVDRIYSLGGRDRGAVLDEARQEAAQRAVVAGARPASVRVVEVDEVPIAYLPGDSVRVRVKAVGDLELNTVEQEVGAS
ncbi:hydantoinase/oxoprolinase family protein [Marinactinospora endophytica]